MLSKGCDLAPDGAIEEASGLMTVQPRLQIPEGAYTISPGSSPGYGMS
jgi:hypothetical protein